MNGNRSVAGSNPLKMLGLVVLAGLAVAFLMATTAPLWGRVAVHVVPVIPDPTSPDVISTVYDSAAFDLSRWPDYDENAMTRAHMTNRLRLVKHAPADQYVAHFATSGAGIDFTCTRRCEVYKQQVPGHDGEQAYAVAVDVADVAPGTEFDVTVNGIYYDGFRNPDSENASVYTGSHAASTRHLSLRIIAPDTLPLQSVSVSSYPAGRATERGLVTMADGVYWRVHDLSPDTHYIISWSW